MSSMQTRAHPHLHALAPPAPLVAPRTCSSSLVSALSTDRSACSVPWISSTRGRWRLAFFWAPNRSAAGPTGGCALPLPVQGPEEGKG